MVAASGVGIQETLSPDVTDVRPPVHTHTAPHTHPHTPRNTMHSTALDLGGGLFFGLTEELSASLRRRKPPQPPKAAESRRQNEPPTTDTHAHTPKNTRKQAAGIHPRAHRWLLLQRGKGQTTADQTAPKKYFSQSFKAAHTHTYITHAG